MQEQGDVLTPLPPHERLRGSMRATGQNCERLLAQLPAEAERAVHDVTAPAFPQAGNIGVLVDQARGNQHPARPATGAAGQGDFEAAAWQLS